MIKVQKVCRTGTHYHDNYSNIKSLADLLEEGYVVVMCNPIGSNLEYIVEKNMKIFENKVEEP